MTEINAGLVFDAALELQPQILLSEKNSSCSVYSMKYGIYIYIIYIYVLNLLRLVAHALIIAHHTTCAP